MAVARPWRSPPPLEGPFRARLEDVSELNQVFSDAFTERYRRDGMVGVRVPFLNPSIWRYALRDADEGAMIWRDDRRQIAAFNIVHRSGAEGWMGPLAVRTDKQGAGVGKDIVSRGIEWLAAQGARVIGLETMPRTLDNIGFYSRMGFLPGRLTLTTTLEAVPAEQPSKTLGKHSPRDKDDIMAECRRLVHGICGGYDYSREIAITDELGLGDTILLWDGDAIVGYALAHTTPLVEGRAREEVRVLKLVLAEEARFESLVRQVMDFARRAGARRVAFRMQTDYAEAYRQAIALGAHVRWSDLRMSLTDHEERRPKMGLVFSNWEI